MLPGPCRHPPLLPAVLQTHPKRGPGALLAREGSVQSDVRALRTRSQSQSQTRVFFSRRPGPQPVLVPSHLGFASARITVQLSWVLRAGNRVCTQGKCQSSARVWDAVSFARAQVRGAVSFTRAQVPSLKPTHHFCPRKLSGSRSAAGHPLGHDSGHRGGQESTPIPKHSPPSLLCPRCNPRGYFCPFSSIYCARAVCGWRRLWCLLCDCFLPAHNLLP